MRKWCPSCYYWEVFTFTGKEEVKKGKLYHEAECAVCGETIYVFIKEV